MITKIIFVQNIAPVTAREIYEGNEIIKNIVTEGININLKSKLRNIKHYYNIISKNEN